MNYAAPTGKLLASIELSDQKVNLWHGSVRSAKTITSLWRWLLYIAKDAPPGPLMMAGQTRDTVYRNCIEPLMDMAPKHVGWNAGTSTVTIMGRPVFVLGASDVRAERKLRGVTLAGAYIDEATLVTQEFWNRTTDRLSLPGSQLFATTNPDRPTHWLNQQWLKRAHELSMAVFHFTLNDNPWLDPSYVRQLQLQHQGVWYLRYILGRWVSAEGAIWPAFNETAHVVDDLPALQHAVVALDYGTVNPLHALVLGVGTQSQGQPPRLYVAREWEWDSVARGGQLTDQEYSANLRRWANDGFPTQEWQPVQAPPVPVAPGRWVVDPAAASMVLQLQNDGLQVQGADNTVLLGLRNVGGLFKADRLHIHRSATRLIEQVQGYSWDEKAAAKGDEKPLKEDDHGPDALRYGVQALWTQWRRWLRQG